MIVTLKVGQTVLVHSNPKDINGVATTKFQPGQFGNTGIMWLVETSGKVSSAPVTPGEGVDNVFTGLAVGATVVTISGVPLSGGDPVTFAFNINVLPADPVGPQDLAQFDPVAEDPIG